MLRFLPLIILSSCVVSPSPTPIATEFDEAKRDWLEVYAQEIKAAMENEDEPAYHFFMREYLAEKVRLWKLKKQNAPKGVNNVAPH